MLGKVRGAAVLHVLATCEVMHASKFASFVIIARAPL